MIKRLKIKFVCINMLIVTLMLTVIFGMVLHITRANMEKQSHRLMQSLHGFQNHKDPVFMKDRLPHMVVMLDELGNVSVVSDSFQGNMDTKTLMPFIQDICDKEEKTGLVRELELRYSRTSTPFGEEIVFVDTSMERSVMKGLLKTCGNIAMMSFCIFLAISVLFAQWAVKPVEEAWKKQRQFVADASHELKTPLTVIMTNAELLQNQSYDAEQRMRFSQSIHVMSLQMRGLVEGLLNLARMDNGVIKREFTAVDFSELIDEGLLPFEPVFFERGMELQSRIHPELWVRGSDSHLRQVLDILLDNAVKYAYPDTTVTAVLEKTGIYCLLSVSNTGDSLSRADLKNIFKRFYRIDSARTMNQSYGLGLSIAEGIVREHRGKIWAESQNGINTFYVQLPLLRNGRD